MNPRINYREAARCGNCAHLEQFDPFPASVIIYSSQVDCQVDGTVQIVERDWICERHEYAQPPKRAEAAGARRERRDDE